MIEQSANRMKNEQKIIAIIPAFNEENKIGKVISKISGRYVDTILVIDDCSTDATCSEATSGGAVVLRHDKNSGVGAAIRSGIEYAVKNKYHIALVLSGDDQHKPSEIPIMLEPLLKEGYDFVQGSRFLDGTRIENADIFRTVMNKFYAFAFRVVTGFLITDVTNGFKAFKVSIFENTKINLRQEWLNAYELEPFLLYKVIEEGYKVKEVPVTIIYHKQRSKNTKMKPIRDWWRLFRPLVFLKLKIKR